MTCPTDITERRKDKRIKDMSGVAFQAMLESSEDDSTKICQAIIQDISLGGIRVHCDNYVPVNTPIKINLTLDRSRKFLSMYGKIRWIRSLYEGESYEFGVQFEQITPQDSMNLLQHLFGH